MTKLASMKTRNLYPFLFLQFCFIFTVFAQEVPRGINYQAVVRNDAGEPLANTIIDVQVGLYISEDNQFDYREKHQVTTNDFGQFSLIIGQGQAETGTFSEADWGQKNYQLSVTINGIDGFDQPVLTKLQSVPYALYADRAKTVDGMPIHQLSDVAEATPASGQVLKWDGNQWVPADEMSGGVGDDWGQQTTQTNTTLSGDGTDENPLKIAPQGADAGQVLTWDGTDWKPDDLPVASGGSGDDWGGQTVQSDASLSGEGTTGNPLALAPQGATAGQVLKWDGSEWKPENDDKGGEINAIKPGTGLLGGGTSGNLTISAETEAALWNANKLQGKAVAEKAPADGQVLKWDGNQWIPDEDNAGSSVWEKTENAAIYNGKLGLNTDEMIGAASFTIKSHNTDTWGGMYVDVDGAGRAMPFYGYAVNGDYKAWTEYRNATKTWSVSHGENNYPLNVNENGKVGVGVYKPASKLHLHTTSGKNYLRITDNTTGVNETNGLIFGLNGAGSAYIRNLEDKPMHFGTDASTRMTIANDGNIGIGTTIPSSNLHMHASSGINYLRITDKTTGVSQTDGLIVGLNGAGKAFIYNRENESMSFGTNATTRMTITSDGKIGINRVTPRAPLEIKQKIGPVTLGIDPNEGPGLRLTSPSGNYWDVFSDNDKFLSFYFNARVKATIDHDDGDYKTWSDRRLKKNIRPMDNVLPKVLELKPSTYHFKDTDEEAPLSYGFIAQEVKAIFPDLVTEANGYYNLAYKDFAVLAIAAIQEQQVMIDALKKEIQTLRVNEAKVAKLAEKLSKIEAMLLSGENPSQISE